MPIHSIEITSEYLKICKASNDCETLYFAGIIMPDGQEKADAIALFLQEEYLDTRQKLNTLPPDDPDRTTDPARPDLFWDGPGSPGQTDLVGRGVIITVRWTGSRYMPRLRRTT